MAHLEELRGGGEAEGAVLGGQELQGGPGLVGAGQRLDTRERRLWVGKPPVGSSGGG